MKVTYHRIQMIHPDSPYHVQDGPLRQSISYTRWFIQTVHFMFKMVHSYNPYHIQNGPQRQSISCTKWSTQTVHILYKMVNPDSLYHVQDVPPRQSIPRTRWSTPTVHIMYKMVHPDWLCINALPTKIGYTTLWKQWSVLMKCWQFFIKINWFNVNFLMHGFVLDLMEWHCYECDVHLLQSKSEEPRHNQHKQNARK